MICVHAEAAKNINIVAVKIIKINKDLEHDKPYLIYKINDFGHGLEYVKYVIERSLKFVSEVSRDINYDMVYAIAAYHNMGHYVNPKNHKKVSADLLYSDKRLKQFFNGHEIKIMGDTICDHRASLKTEPKNIYGKILFSADRNTSVKVILIK